MKVKSTSWHYRFNVWMKGSWDTKHKKDLCSYFWFTVRNVLAALIMATLGVAMAVMGPYALGAIPMEIMGFTPEGWAALGAWGIGAVFVFIIGGATVGCAILHDMWVSRDRPQKAPGLVKSYYQANVKEKVCPFIEFED
jgi:hypothetical protein